MSPTNPFENNNNVPNEEITSVLEELSKRTQRRNNSTVIVGESLSTVEGVIRGVMERFEKGQVPKELKYVEFLSLPLFSLINLSKEEIEQKLLELRCIVNRCLGKRVIFYLGDLKWVSEFWSNYGDQQRSFYSPVEQIIMEIKRLLFHGNNGESYGKFWVLGIATFQMYMRCKAGHPSLESLWSLHPLTVPVGSLSLSLNFESKDCNFQTKSAMAFSLCLEQYKEEAKKSAVIDNQQDDQCEKWNNHKGINFLEKSLNFSPSSTSDFCHPFLGPKQSPKEYQFWDSDEPERSVAVSKPELLSNPNSSPNSASSSEVVIEEEEEDEDFSREALKNKQFNNQNLKLISNSLLKTIPNYPKDKADEISATILQCRSLRSPKSQESCCLFFMGTENQNQAKEKTARELAKLFFGSQTKLISIGLSSFKQKIDEQKFSKKRGRDEMGSSYLQRFGEAVNENPHRVFFMEDIEEIDYCSLKGMKEAIEKGKVKLSDGEFCPLNDAIIIFNAQKQSVKQKLQNGEEEEEEEEKIRFVSLDLNINAIEEANGDRIRSIMECVDGKILFS